MKILFRVDASLNIGTGHVMRCLTLADALRERGDDCIFVCRPHIGHLSELISSRGHGVFKLKKLTTQNKKNSDNLVYEDWLGVDWLCDAQDTLEVLGEATVDWLVVDHYALDWRWEKCLRSICKRLMVLDDLANRVHDCDLLLDQNLGRTEQDYSHLLPPNANVLIGPEYSLLRPEFAKLRATSLGQRAQRFPKNILISMGGIDSENFTTKILAVLKKNNLPEGTRINVVMGSQAPWLEQVRLLVKEMSQYTQLHVNVTNIEYLMKDCDLAIGAAGGTAWERCCLGVPTLIFVIADNQRAGAAALQKVGAAFVIESMLEFQLFIENNLLSNNSSLIRRVSMAAAKVTDGSGVTKVLKFLN